MGHGFGELFKLRGIITYTLSPFEQRAFAGAISHGIPNTLRRMRETVLYFVPPFALGYLIFDQIERAHHKTMRKDPAEFANDV